MAAVFGLAHVELRPLGFGQASAVIGSDEQDVGAAVIFGPVLNEAKYLSSFDLISYLVRSRVANAAGNEHTGSHHNAEEAHWVSLAHAARRCHANAFHLVVSIGCDAPGSPDVPGLQEHHVLAICRVFTPRWGAGEGNQRCG